MAIELPKTTVPNSRVGSANTLNTSQRPQTASVTGNATPATKMDSVSLTSQAQQLQNVQSKLASLPEVDVKKVAEIKLAIAEGRYKVDPEKLAANITRFEHELEGIDPDA